MAAARRNAMFLKLLRCHCAAGNPQVQSKQSGYVG